MRRTSQTLAIAVLATGLTGALVLPAEAATPPVRFAKFYADQPGSDLPYTNTRLNREYIQVKNVSKKTVSLSGYLIHDRGSEHTYHFPKTFRLGAGKTVTLHTGKGRNSAASLYWGRKSMVWNNTSDTAYLMKGRTKVDTCTYKQTAAQKRAKTGYTYC